MKNKVASFSLLVAAALVGTAVIARSAPVVPGRGPLTDPVKSLRKLRSVYLKIHVASPQADRAGITAEKIRARWAKWLTAARFDVVDEDSPQVARLELMVRSVAKRGQQGMALMFLMRLHQRVTIDRTGQKLRVPTYTQDLGGLEDKKNFEHSVRRSLDGMLDRFIAECAAATTAKQ